MVIEQKFKVGEEPDPTEWLFISMEQKRKDQTLPYDAKTNCWVPDPDEGFVRGEIVGTPGETISVKMPSGQDQSFKKDLVVQVNPPKYEKSEDMSNLTYLNDASVLHNLKSRYQAQLIYTYSGLFCIAINPYKRFPIYTPRAMRIYQGRRRNEVPPHIFAIADGAYSEMQTNHENQSILITGESGAGKTENTKKVIAYFANIGASDKKVDVKKISLEDQIVQTNPVLEAFGNAKTTRNDNSSRFGKFIRIHFSPNGKLAGADIETYLLEKARVVSQMAAERGYHIFYQLMSGKVKGMKDMLMLSDDIYDYHFCSQGKTTIAGIDDGEEMDATHTAFEVLGFTSTERDNVYNITAAVMHMGEMKFKQKGREEQAEADGTVEGDKVAKLLGVNGEDLYKNFTKPKIKVGTEFVTKGQNKDQCLYSVSAMAKGLFDRVFLFLVKKCNDTLDTKQHRASFIGVLDIAGFEIFDYNGFEQLCINFTNEKLQQFFNHHMFVLEQEEYKKEGLDWIFEDFGMDLAACIELMEKPMGVFAILEEQSMFPKATDQSFADMLKTNHLGKSPNFIKPKPPKPGCSEAHFSCVHYAGTVPYSITGWLEKNKDPLNDTVVDQFKKGTNELIHTIFANHPGQSGAAAAADSGGGGKKKKGFATVSSSFREQLNSLMTTLKATHPHFIRCIVPNETKTPGAVEASLIMHQLTCNGVLEGIRICRKGFPNRMLYDDFKHRYIILAPSQMKAEKEEKKIGFACFNTIQLDPDKYRLGHTKVFFRAGVLGEMEEIRDEKLGKLLTWLQASIRRYNGMRECQRLKDQRTALLVCQRSIRGYTQLLTWAWKDLMEKIKPFLGDSKAGDEIRQLEDKAKEAQEAWEKEEQARKEIEEKNARLLAERNELQARLEGESSALSEYQEKITKAQNDKGTFELRLNELTTKLQKEEESCARLLSDKKKLDQEMVGIKKELEDLEIHMHKSDSSKSTKEHQIRSLNDEIARQDEAINKFNKEKKLIQEQNLKAVEELQGCEDKVNHLSKIKNKLESTMDELEDVLEREKKQRNETDKQKRKIEGDLKLMSEAISDLERDKKELENTLIRKDKDISSLATKLDDEQASVGKLQRAIKEFQARIEEREEEVESERQARAKAEKQTNEMHRELEDLKDRLDEAGGATSAQIELNKKREAELSKLRRDVEESKIQHESAMHSIRNKNTDAVAEMSEQIDTLNKLKTKAERERQAMASEFNDIRHAIDHLASEKASHEKVNKNLASQINELQSRVEETSRNLGDFSQAKSRLETENCDVSRQLEDALSQISQLNKYKISLTTQLDEVKRTAEEESRGRAGLVNKYRMVEHRVDTLKEQVNEEENQKADLLRQLAKAHAEVNSWKNKFTSEGMGKAEQAEENKRRLQCRLNEAESQIEAINQKVLSLEKSKQMVSSELDDLAIELDRVRTISMALSKKEKCFDKVVQEWKSKVDSLTSELDTSQKDCRNYSTEHFRYKSALDEVAEHLEGVKRENKALGDEIKDLMDQMGEGGRAIHEFDKNRRRLEAEKEELQAALEEAESAVEQEENRVLKAQVELSQIHTEIQRRIRDKEDEFDHIRKNHQRAIESLQLSLESEAKSKAEALRIKKKLESDINELESALDFASKSNQELQKSIKKHYQELKDMQARVEDEIRNRDEAKEACIQSERRANGVAHDLEESRSLLEIADRARRAAEQEITHTTEQLNDIAAQVSSTGTAKRKLESELKTLQADLEEILSECRGSEEKAKRAMVDAARLADELRIEQENSRTQERMRKQMELQAKDLQVRLDEAESAAQKGDKRAASKLEERIKQLESELDGEQKQGGETLKNIRKTERLIKELGSKSDEDKKNLDRMQDAIDKSNQKLKTFKSQIEEAEEIAALNLAKFRKAQQDLEEALERAEATEHALSKLKSKGRAGSVH